VGSIPPAGTTFTFLVSMRYDDSALQVGASSEENRNKTVVVPTTAKVQFLKPRPLLCSAQRVGFSIAHLISNQSAFQTNLPTFVRLVFWAHGSLA
jgi:hypothetical protein